VLRGKANCAVSVSTDAGATWKECGTFSDGLDLTDQVKGHRQWHLRFHSSASQLAKSALSITTICQANPATFPRLKDGGTRIRQEIGNRAVISFGPNKAQATPRIVEGAFDSPKVTLEFATPRGEPVRVVHVAAQVASSNPPNPAVRYHADYSLDGGKNWHPLLKDGQILRRGVEPQDFWSQSLWSASVDLPENTSDKVRVRFFNDGGKRYLRAEGHLLYPVASGAPNVSFAWNDESGDHRETRKMTHAETWNLTTGTNVKTQWVEIAAE